MADGPERDEKTEEATARRREEARDKGQVAYSSETVVVAMLGAALGGLLLVGGGIAEAAGALVESSIALIPVLGVAELDVAEASEALGSGLRRVVPRCGDGPGAA